MQLNPGKSLGPYEILDAIGAGGMGEVYKARDTRLNRLVAVKVLPEGVALDAERKQRFEREAQTIAALNHPNICVVHDVGQDGGTHYLVMEYLEGDTLAARIEKGPLPLDQALKCAIEVGDALDKAHGHDVVHRDVKPANIILTKSGAKLLDFGLAKAGAASIISGASQAPTNLTMQGTIVGTPHYMAPEQVEGNEPDARSDIFALGVVLYEMLTGNKAFTGKSYASLMASILEHDPTPISTVQATMPRALDRVVRTALAKDPESRWQSMRDFVVQLKWILEGSSEADIPITAGTPRKYRERVAWALLALSLVGLMFLVVSNFRTKPVETPLVEFSIPPPEDTVFAPPSLAVAPFPEVSPDGRHIVFVASKGASSEISLWVRSLDSSAVRQLPGTEGAVLPFWSADSREIGFFSAGKLKRVSLSGGAPFVISEKVQQSGGAWNRDGTIVFVLPGTGAIYRVSAMGGQPIQLTKPNTSKKEAHGLPHFLPDGVHFLYRDFSTGTNYVGSLDSGEPKKILSADSEAIYAAPGYLLFVRQGTLLGQAFDAGRLQLAGDPFRVAENVRILPSGVGAFSVSDNGVLVYRAGGGTDSLHAAFFDRNGKQLPDVNQNGDSRYPRLSPDEHMIAVQRGTADKSDVWIIDVARGTNTRLTFNETSETFPIWTPDGKYIEFASNQNGKWDLYQKLASGVGNEELVFKSDQDKFPLDVSPDGRFLLFRMDDPKTGQDMWLLPLTGERQPKLFVQTPFADNGGRFSPDGKWIAYFSTESGTSQIYVQPFPATGARWQVSVDGGTSVAWGNGGKELFFIGSSNRVMSVEVSPGSEFRAGIPKPLFQIPALPSNSVGLRFSATKDGQRFLLPVNATVSDYPLTVLLNWTGTLKK